MESLEQRSLPAVITVTSLADTVAGDGRVTLREALQAANTDSAVDGVTGSGTDTIRFDPTLTAGGPATITLNGTQLVISSNLTIDGPGATNLTIDANRQSRIFLVDDGNYTSYQVVAINGLRLINGTTQEDGGAVHNRENLTLVKAVIANNSAHNGSGISSYYGQLTVDRTRIRHNSAEADGGGIRANGWLTMKLSTVMGNSSGKSGGGIAADGAVSISNSTVAGNIAGAEGGGIAFHFGAGLVVRTSSITNNSAATSGGGIYHNNEHMLRVIRSTVSENSAGTDGGGIYCLANDVKIGQTTISGNTALGSGGGILAHAGERRKLRVIQSTICGNSAAQGGGIATEPDKPALNEWGEHVGPGPSREDGDIWTWMVTLVLQNSIVAGNNGSSGPSDLASVRAANMTLSDVVFTDLRRCTNNLIGDPNTSMGIGRRGASYGENGNIVGQPDASGARTVIPISSILDTTLRDNGGRTKTLMLVSSSSAIDRGNATLIPGVQFDQRGAGFIRVIGSNVDIGAVELNPQA